MKWYWYSSRSYEIFLDIDKFEKCENHIRRRLQGAIEYEHLHVRDIIEAQSITPGHKHIILVLDNSLSPIERAVWEIILHGDIYRGCSTIMRIEKGVPHPDILISQFGFLISRNGMTRHHDAFCDCGKKHKMEVMKDCPAAIQLRGENRVQGFFGKPSDNPCKWMP